MPPISIYLATHYPFHVVKHSPTLGTTNGLREKAATSGTIADRCWWWRHRRRSWSRGRHSAILCRSSAQLPVAVTSPSLSVPWSCQGDCPGGARSRWRQVLVVEGVAGGDPDYQHTICQDQLTPLNRLDSAWHCYSSSISRSQLTQVCHNGARGLRKYVETITLGV